jgi:tetratricopeptide (TPR) repeat protein
MWPRLAASAVVLLAVAVLVVGVTRPGDGRAADRLGDSQTDPSAAVLAAPASPAASTTVGRDATVAFWKARVADGGGYLSALHLVDALIERSRATGDLADLERASSVLESAAGGAPPGDAGLPFRQGRIAFALHDFSTARAAAEEALSLQPDDPTGLALLGDVSLELGDIARADEAYRALAKAGPIRSPAILSRLARRTWLEGRVDRAEKLVRDAIAGAQLAGTDDERAFFQFQLAEMLRARNALGDAEEAYRAALRSQPDHVPSLGGLARVLEEQGRRDEAIPLLEAATGRLPAPELVAALGDLYALDGRAGDAEDQWALVERIAEVAQAVGGVHDRQLVLFLADHDRDLDRAVELARAEIAVRGDVYGHDALAWALFKAGRLDEAADAADRALHLGTPDGRFHFHAGLIAAALGRDAEARTHLEAAAARSASLPPSQVPVLEAALERLAP